MFAKNERGYRLTVKKESLLIATDLTSICSVYKEKIVENDSYQRTKRIVQIPFKFRKMQHSTRIVNKSILFQTNHSDITNNSHRLLFVIKIKDIMKYQLYTNASKNYR